MYRTPWSDGVAGVSQRSIRPGETFIHRWKATQHGSYWYHAHERGQLEDGLFGPIIIRPSHSAAKPFGLISNDSREVRAMEKAERETVPLLLSDWRHTTADETWNLTLRAGFEVPCFDSVLINGKGSVRCRTVDEINSLLKQEQKDLLKAFNSTMTDKA